MLKMLKMLMFFEPPPFKKKGGGFSKKNINIFNIFNISREMLKFRIFQL